MIRVEMQGEEANGLLTPEAYAIIVDSISRVVRGRAQKIETELEFVKINVYRVGTQQVHLDLVFAGQLL